MTLSVYSLAAVGAAFVAIAACGVNYLTRDYTTWAWAVLMCMCTENCTTTSSANTFNAYARNWRG
jgi:hypothetical protein